MMDRRLLVGVLVGACVTLGAAAAWKVWLRGPRTVDHRTSLGLLRIPLKQLEEAVARLGRRIPGVARLKVRMTQRQSGLHVAMNVRLKPDTTANAVLDSLRQTAVTGLESMLGEAPQQVRLDVTAPDTRVSHESPQRMDATR